VCADLASEDLLWKTLTPKRWALLKLMAGQGSMSIREIARRADRDVRAVHSDQADIEAKFAALSAALQDERP